ncbi:MAG: four helix bundle protein [Candidatus Faecousia sp.]|nr:four helix bundle protein [Clostridiales bacterium]MDD5882476.1 four helix bundle protein [Bacillota bacterium]MDY4598424.1 four helix bundle protein [Candidatus Faecousia sp.]
MSNDSAIKKKSMAFAKRIVGLYQYLCRERHEFVMSKQVLRSGTSVGANVAEAIYGSSRKDFAAKLQIARKESAETLYWLELLHECDYLPDKLFQSLYADCKELMALLTAAIKSCEE